MKKETIYWTTKNGNKIDIDDMSVDHLRNVLKMLVKYRNNYVQVQSQEDNSELANRRYYENNSIAFSDSEVSAIINKTQYQWENEENLWK